MKLTHYGNAFCEYSHAGFRLLADPWLLGTPFETWGHSPPLKTKIQDILGADAIYISHCHQDHLDRETLQHFRRDVPIVILDEPLHISARALRGMGFTNVAEVGNGVTHKVGPFTLKLFGPWVGHPFHATDTGNAVDSAMLVMCDGKSILNCNDNTLTPHAACIFRAIHAAPDVAQLNSNGASCYPATFRNLTHEEKLAERERILLQQHQNLVEVSKALGAKRVQPFAGQFQLVNGKEHLNQYLPVWDTARIGGFLEEHGVKALCLREGESYELA